MYSIVDRLSSNFQFHSNITTNSIAMNIMLYVFSGTRAYFYWLYLGKHFLGHKEHVCQLQ